VATVIASFKQKAAQPTAPRFEATALMPGNQKDTLPPRLRAQQSAFVTVRQKEKTKMLTINICYLIANG
jgi:hypothetical protein